MSLDTPLDLPGLDGPREYESPMVVAARSTLQALAELGRLEPRHAVLTQLILSLAEAIDRGTRTGRASAVALASKELREALLQLDPPPEDGDQAVEARASLAELFAKLELAANGAQPS
jgi:hypothetical protein